MSVSYKMKHAKQHAWTIEEKNEDGSKTGAKLKQKVLTVLSAFVLMVIIGLIFAMIYVTSMSAVSDNKSNHKECMNFSNQTHWKYKLFNDIFLAAPCRTRISLNASCPNVSTTPLRQWGFRQRLPFSWTTLRDKHCRHPIAVMGVVDTFRHGPLSVNQLKNDSYR